MIGHFGDVRGRTCIGDFVPPLGTPGTSGAVPFRDGCPLVGAGAAVAGMVTVAALAVAAQVAMRIRLTEKNLEIRYFIACILPCLSLCGKHSRPVVHSFSGTC